MEYLGDSLANPIKINIEWSDEVDIEGYLPTFELQRKEL